VVYDLDGWKQIADYLGVTILTAQRRAKWKTGALPLSEEKHGKVRRVFAVKRELDEWKDGRVMRRPPSVPPAAGKINLVGNWKYEFRVTGRPTVWGGVIEIDQAETSLGVKLTLRGYRLWEKSPRKKMLINPIDWESDWGTICHDGRIRFSYVIKSKKTVNGFAVGTILTPDKIDGHFYQLPPHSSAAHGPMHLRRITGDEDTKRPAPEISVPQKR
jgi:hypothetical protein